jgi:DNA-binding IclR family transcriptional regulator
MSVSTGATTPRLLGSAMKCLALLDALASESGPAGVSELARRTETARGTTYQRLQTLVAAGWVEAVGEGKYRLTRLARARPRRWRCSTTTRR